MVKKPKMPRATKLPSAPKTAYALPKVTADSMKKAALTRLQQRAVTG
jgi:hypothetical protein